MRLPDKIKDLSKKIVELSPWNIRAVVLCGSFAKGEESIVIENNETHLLSDYDLEVLVKVLDPKIMRKIDALVKQTSLDVSIGIIPLFYLKKLKMIQIYELKKNGIVIFGNKSHLDEISLEIPSDIPKWEGIRLLLNAIMDMNALVKHENLLGKINNFQFRSMVYACAKAYLACCRALLTSIGEYRTSLSESYALFSEIYVSKFQSLSKILPDLPNKVKFGLEFKLNPTISRISRSPSFWFEARNYILKVLQYNLSLYLRKPEADLFVLLNILEDLPVQPLLNILYSLSLLMKMGKMPPLSTFFNSPMILAQISGVYIISAVDESGFIKKSFIKTAFQKIRKVYPVKEFCESWDLIKQVIINVWKLAPTHALEKDIMPNW
ncbi:MAG: hypothetical protein ACFFCD_03625 [Promethearchaeota archaeon]